MTRMSADDRRELLVQAAISVMARDGVSQATTRAIVAEAGMPLGVFHYCFRSKGELLEQVMVTISQTSFGAVLPVLEGTEDFGAIVRAGLRAYWAHIEEDPKPHQLTYELTQYALRVSPEAAAKQYDAYLRGCELFLAGLADVTAHRWTLSVDVVARYLLAIVEGVTLQWLVDQDRDAAVAVLDAFGRTVETWAEPA